MRCTLTLMYSLTTRGNAKEKHEIRMKFSEQLGKLVKTQPFILGKSKLANRKWHKNKYIFFPLVPFSSQCSASLKVRILDRQQRGYLIGRGGDIDNRLKTILDALRIPNEGTDMKGVAPGNRKRIYTLLEDDRQVSSLSVEISRWMVEGPPNEVFVIIDIETQEEQTTYQSIDVLG